MTMTGDTILMLTQENTRLQAELEVLKSANAQLSVILDERDTELREALRWKPEWLPLDAREGTPEQWHERTEQFIKELQSARESAESRVRDQDEALGNALAQVAALRLQAWSAESRIAEALGHVRRIYDHYSPEEIARANPLSQLGHYREAVRVLEGVESKPRSRDFEDYIERHPAVAVGPAKSKPSEGGER